MTTHRNNSASVRYSERQWVPWYFWFNGAVVIVIAAATFGLNRGLTAGLIAAAILAALGTWILISWSSTVLTVEQDQEGTRWLTVAGAQLPDDVVSRSLAVPKSARRNALGPQLDPAAFLVTHPWIETHAMFILDDPEDPTPYWMVATKDPQKLIAAFVPDQAAQATKGLK
ncbi:membrane protein [Corynebacterium phocae]|uniref:Membrane protein n=1 Tax=Corynebacterium phocae TaxID=161895 RepID=A0A1L7D327_9CORY|nr:DUF3093 domain-containing protein [Corynebacterium phocae]APT92401.1 membrane protein [Corynebacterium phocae]KAA8724995.1 DUF3093 domain-containing protein [Corynebacterium phocae]